MRLSRGMVVLGILFVIIISSCSMISSPLKKAEKLTESADIKSAQNNKEGAIADYKKAIALYEQIVAKSPGTDNALKAQLAMGKIYIDKLEQREKGLEMYQKVIDSAPETELASEAMWRAATNYFKNKEYEQAAPVFNDIVNTFPTTERGKDAQIMLAKSYEEGENYEKAAEVYEQFANRYPDDKHAATALQNRAMILREHLNNEEEAIKADQKLVAKFAKNNQVSKMVTDAKKRLENVGADIPEPEEEMQTQREKAIERQKERRNKNRPDVGISPAMKGKTEQSEAGKYFGVDPDDIMRQFQITADSQGTMYDAMFMIADMLYASGEYNKAGALYEKAIEMASKENKRPDPRNYRKLADCYRKIGLNDIAMEVLKKGVRRDPGIIDSIIVSGETQHAAGEYDKAIETYQSVIGLSKAKDPDLYWHIGLVHRARGEHIQELEMIEKAVAMRPTDKELLQELAVTLYHSLGLRDEAYIFDRLAKDEGTNRYDVQKGLADLCYKHENYNWARTKYNNTIRACEREKNKAESEKDIKECEQHILLMKVRLAVTEARKGNLDTAQQSLEQLQKENPEHPYIYYGLGELALISGDTENGLAKLNKALELDPSIDYAAIALKNYYMQQEKTDEAIKVLENFVENNPYNKMMKLELKKIKPPEKSSESASG